MKVLIWNVNGATDTSRVWDYILEVDPDIALLQEVRLMPVNITTVYNQISLPGVKRDGGTQQFSTVVLAKKVELQPKSLSSSHTWVNKKLKQYDGNLTYVSVAISGEVYNIVSVYSPAWELDTGDLTQEERDMVQLESQSKIFLTEVLWSSLKQTMNDGENWIVGGDFNSSETFDKSWQKANGVRYGLQSNGNREIIERMNSLGLFDGVREYYGEIVPTYKAVRSNEFLHQMDHMYVSKPMLETLLECSVGDTKLVLEEKLSDHLPIVAKFNN